MLFFYSYFYFILFYYSTSFIVLIFYNIFYSYIDLDIGTQLIDFCSRHTGLTCPQGPVYHRCVGVQGPPLQAFISAGFSATHSTPPSPSLLPPPVKHTTSLRWTPGPHVAEHWERKREKQQPIWLNTSIWIYTFTKWPFLQIKCKHESHGSILTVFVQSVKYQLVTQGPMWQSSVRCGRSLSLHSLSLIVLPWLLTQRTLLVLFPTPQSTEHCGKRCIITHADSSNMSMCLWR